MNLLLLRVIEFLPSAVGRRLGPHRVALAAEFMRFGTVGAVGFLFDNATVYTLRGPIGLYLAGFAAYGVGATATWALNRVWTFRGRGSRSRGRQWALFLAANAFGFVLNRGTYVALIAWSPLCAAYPVFAVAGGTLSGMCLNFHLSRTVVFRAPQHTAAR